MFSKCEQRCFIKIQIARGTNAHQCHTVLVEGCGKETLRYRTLAKWAYAFRRAREDVHQWHTAIIPVEKCFGRLVGL